MNDLGLDGLTIASGYLGKARHLRELGFVALKGDTYEALNRFFQHPEKALPAFQKGLVICFIEPSFYRDLLVPIPEKVEYTPAKIDGSMYSRRGISMAQAQERVLSSIDFIPLYAAGLAYLGFAVSVAAAARRRGPVTAAHRHTVDYAACHMRANTADAKAFESLYMLQDQERTLFEIDFAETSAAWTFATMCADKWVCDE
jgi:hypothetical protein